MLRADALELYRSWTEIPAVINTRLLCHDLEDINHHRLAGRYHPPPPPPDGPDEQGQRFCFVRLIAMPDCAEHGHTNARNLRPKRG